MGRARIIGLVCLGAAFGAFAAVPALHILGHEDDHVHINGAIVYFDHQKQHEHERQEREKHQPKPAPDRAPLRHGAGSVAHFAAFSLTAQTPILPTPVVYVTQLSLESERPSSRSIAKTHRARAPPAR